MKLLIVGSVDPWTRSVSTIHHYVAAGRALGHEVAVYGPPHSDLPGLAYTTDLKGVDLALFVMQLPNDLPDMPYLARLMDGVPHARRAIVDLWGRYNETIRVEHDFNHLEKFDGHFAWDWEASYRAISDVILQPTTATRRADAKPFLFHGFDPASVVKPYTTAKQAAAAWRDKPRGVMYAGSNWQRWEQVRVFLEGYAPVRAKIGPAALLGWDWWARPEWAVKQGIFGNDVDAEFLTGLGVEILNGVRFDEIPALLGSARFTPVLHRPLFRELNYVTVRSFETFQADTIPILMLPRDFVRDVFGLAALTLVPEGSVGDFMLDALANPEKYWEAVLRTRAHLAHHHSFARRIQDIAALARGRA